MQPAAGAEEPSGPPTLFLAVLGGRLPGAHIELHDVRFVVGHCIDDTLPELARQWFGSRRGLHLDSWMAVRCIDGYRVELRPEPFPGAERLWFVNMGGYDPAQLAEQHGFALVVATSAQGAKAKARTRLLPGLHQRHKDDLYGVDDCLEVQIAAGMAVHLIPAGCDQPQVPDWYGYRPF